MTKEMFSAASDIDEPIYNDGLNWLGARSFFIDGVSERDKGDKNEWEVLMLLFFC
ncbi:hypothetical protein [Aliivibrio sp. SR45-2]|uniref:hypothetical protein n=1 Tax=Aliivibrio sp. SR45-2 TaxID=2760931 RepID=UPI0015FE6FE7|nr:hypothetical protein [Aliivibrio sp. SR45-2]MBB1313434.1 hypothetical protein [Aliivibrio sp. SR45-2]